MMKTTYKKVKSCSFNGQHLTLKDADGNKVERWERDHMSGEAPSEFLNRIEPTVKLFGWDLEAQKIMAKLNGWR